MTYLRVALYLLAVVTCLTCTALLGREYLKTRARLLWWSTLCFACLTINNVLLFADLVIYPEQDLRLVRVLASLTGMLFLLYGFWEADS